MKPTRSLFGALLLIIFLTPGCQKEQSDSNLNQNILYQEGAKLKQVLVFSNIDSKILLVFQKNTNMIVTVKSNNYHLRITTTGK